MTRIENIRLWSLVVSRFALDGGAMFGIIPRPLWQRFFPPDRLGRVHLVSRMLVARFPKSGRVLVVDSGMGHLWTPQEADRFALDLDTPGPREAISSIGIRPDEVTDAIMTHLHFDHSGGWLERTDIGNGVAVQEPRAAFPNAVHYVQKDQWNWAQNPSPKDSGSYRRETFTPLEELELLEVIEGATTLFPGVELIPLSGHTPGLQIPLIRGDKGAAVFLSDLVATRPHVKPPWVMAYDLFPLQTIEEKNRILSRAVEEGWILLFEHDPDTVAARVERTGDGFRVEPCPCPRSI